MASIIKVFKILFIGLNLDKYNEMGNAVGNGTMISTAPIEFRYTCNKIESAVAGDRRKAAINLTFFIEHRRSLIITKLGVKVSDGMASLPTV